MFFISFELEIQKSSNNIVICVFKKAFCKHINFIQGLTNELNEHVHDIIIINIFVTVKYVGLWIWTFLVLLSIAWYTISLILNSFLLTKNYKWKTAQYNLFSPCQQAPTVRDVLMPLVGCRGQSSIISGFFFSFLNKVPSTYNWTSGKRTKTA